MRPGHADFAAVDAALRIHQRNTLNEYAAARGAGTWPREPSACVVAVTLAVDNLVHDLTSRGYSEKAALLAAAAQLDVDIGTLRRRRRHMHQTASRRTSPAKYSLP